MMGLSKVKTAATGFPEAKARDLTAPTPMRMPVNDLVSNGAYMVMAALAWNLKAWFALLVPERERGLELLKMEFRGFLQAIVLLPVQIIRAGRRLIWRILSYNRWLRDLLATFERIVALEAG